LLILIIFLFNAKLLASGAFDHGTATGKGKLQIDLTWNPFNYFENGQSYAVISYGIKDRIDLHVYYADHGNYKNGVDSYYYGILFQFLDSRHVDLATAIGKRKMNNLNYSHFFFPQLLYNYKIYDGYTIGGSFVRIQKDTEKLMKNMSEDWFAIDIALFIPLKRYFLKYNKIDDVKLGIGVFRTGIKGLLQKTTYMPTYSLDIKFKINKN
tara:strand:+ start:617 stop:1246 length:630 start_codon:yes stop_codon:yes gene_type:complete